MERPNLTKRQVEVLKLISEDMNLKEIAAQLHISEDTVRTHRNNIRTSMGCTSILAACVKAIKMGLI